MSGALLDVSNLRVAFDTPHGRVQAVDGVSFALRRGEVLAIVGESGSGKSVCALSLMGLTRGPRTTIEGSALLEGEQLIGAPDARLRAIRGARMSMVFQDPQSSLNPVLRVGDQIAEQILAHEPSVGRARALARAADLMERAGIADARRRVHAYPHELSGGMRQRVMIAMALSLGARLLLADEPTTALDVTIQAQILAQLKRLQEQEQMGIVLITHDFAVVADVAQRVLVMRAGRIVEEGATGELLRRPRHRYTRDLLRALAPAPAARAARAPGDPLLELDGLRVSFTAQGGLRRLRPARVRALDGVSLTLRERETLAIVGESGSGKTTLARCIARLVEPDGGAIRFAGQDVTHARARRLARLRARLGMVFQDPQASLNPRRRAGVTVQLALRAHGVSRAESLARSLELLRRVGLSAAHASRYPHELSGGERQRVGIARALAGQPRVVLLDEPVSSLDASLRRGVIELLDELQMQIGCSYVLVSHDLSIVAGVADRIAVMRDGQIVELGDARQVLQSPRHPYTRELLAARPPELRGVGSDECEQSPTSPSEAADAPAGETWRQTRPGSSRS